MASVIMAIIALSATIVSAVFIYFGLVVGATRRYFEALMSGRIKWVVAAYSFVCLLLSIASWAIFISFPSALSDADYCPDSFLGTSPLPPQNKYLEYTHLFQLDPFGSPPFLGPWASQALWCGTFVGSETYDINLLFNKISTTIVWFPALGWFFAVLSSFPAFVSFVLALLVRRHGIYGRLTAVSYREVSHRLDD